MQPRRNTFRYMVTGVVVIFLLLSGMQCVTKPAKEDVSKSPGPPPLETNTTNSNAHSSTSENEAPVQHTNQGHEPPTADIENEAPVQHTSQGREPPTADRRVVATQPPKASKTVRITPSKVSFPVLEDVGLRVAESGTAGAASQGTAKIAEAGAGTLVDESFTEPVTGMEFIRVQGGCYMMGSDTGGSYERPVHEVCLDDFYLAKYEVTQLHWAVIKGRDLSYFRGSDLPVERVSWHDVQEFIHELNLRTGMSFRLPTEAEWEYAARSRGRQETYAGTSDETALPDFAWYSANSNGRTHAAGVKRPNALGLHDMSGNVWEWCSDWYANDYYRKSPRENPRGPEKGVYHVIRGGTWELPANLARTTYREGANPKARRYDIGFRLALSAP